MHQKPAQRRKNKARQTGTRNPATTNKVNKRQRRYKVVASNSPKNQKITENAQQKTTLRANPYWYFRNTHNCETMNRWCDERHQVY
jgi:hypothetical protein